jgi:hypothetical protein
VHAWVPAVDVRPARSSPRHLYAANILARWWLCSAGAPGGSALKVNPVAAAALKASAALLSSAAHPKAALLLLSLRRQLTCKVSFGAANAEWIRVASKWITTQLVRFKGCDPGSSLGHAHPHGGASTSSTSANGLAVSPSRAPRAAAIAARRACAGRVHAAVR